MNIKLNKKLKLNTVIQYFLLRTHSFFGRLIWSIITILAFSAFGIQTYYTLHDYLQYRTIIEMQLKFEPGK